MAQGYIVNNLTNQWVFLSQPFIFIPPYTVSAAGPIAGTQKLTARFLAPTGFTQPTTIAGQFASIRTTAELQPSSPGVVIAPANVRWNINSSPAAGAQATATRAAAPGVTHVADFYSFKLIQQSGAVANNPGISILNGPSGSLDILYSSNLSANGATNASDSDHGGPGLGIKGTVGNAMTIEFGAGVVNMLEIVDLVGYDV